MGNSSQKLARDSFFLFEETEREIGNIVPWSSSTELHVTVRAYSQGEIHSAIEIIADQI